MSNLWTPGGDQPQPPASQQGGPPMDGPEPSEAEMQAYVEQLRDQLLSTPAAVVLANHIYGMFELAALHLSIQPPNLADAKLAIEAMGGVLSTLQGKLGEHEESLRSALAEIQMSYVQLIGANQDGGGEEAAPESPPES